MGGADVQEPLGQNAIAGNFKDAIAEIKHLLTDVVASVQHQTSGKRGGDVDASVEVPHVSEVRVSERGPSSHGRSPKLPLFDGSEAWEVWFNRFEDVAFRCRWNEEEKLDALLPRLQGKVGEFVYGQLRREVRNDYRSLTNELKNRFRKVETPRIYGAEFSRRIQQPRESIEEFAGELKRLYDKGHPRRNTETRREDLLRKFFDGLIDEEASNQVEYVKEPIDIDEAVYETVNYIGIHCKQDKKEDEQRRQMKRPTRIARTKASEDEESVARTPVKSIGDARSDASNMSNSMHGSSAHSQSQSAELLTEMKKMREEIKAKHQQIDTQLHQLEIAKYGHTGQGANTARREPFYCFRCGRPGHIARECHNPPQHAMSASAYSRNGNLQGNQQGSK
jgi:hypothetical protein